MTKKASTKRPTKKKTAAKKKATAKKTRTNAACRASAKRAEKMVASIWFDDPVIHGSTGVSNVDCEGHVKSGFKSIDKSLFVKSDRRVPSIISQAMAQMKGAGGTKHTNRVTVIHPMGGKFRQDFVCCDSLLTLKKIRQGVLTGIEVKTRGNVPQFLLDATTPLYFAQAGYYVFRADLILPDE